MRRSRIPILQTQPNVARMGYMGCMWGMGHAGRLARGGGRVLEHECRPQ